MAQGQLAFAKDETNEKQYATAFKRLYYHLYTNSNASRAERIIRDLSNLLLTRIAAERTGHNEIIQKFLDGDGTANRVLLPLVLEAFPHLSPSADSFTLEDSALRHGLRELAPLSFASASGHILGEAFQSLIGSRIRGDKGQFFTPRNLVRAMIEAINPGPDDKVVDPACGTAGFLVEAANYQYRKAKEPAGRLIGIDKDGDLCRLAEASLQAVAPQRSFLINTNSLDLTTFTGLDAAITPLNADVVLTNPPFGANIKVTDKEILKQYTLGHRWEERHGSWFETRSMLNAQDPQVLFIELCIRLMKPGGKLAIVLPEGVFGNTSLGYVWDFIRANCEILGLLDCPRTLFQPSTDTKTNVLFARRLNSGERFESSNVKIAVALNCGHDRRGRDVKADGTSYPDDLAVIGKLFNAETNQDSPWRSVELTDPYYLVPRYYEPAHVEEVSTDLFGDHVEFATLGQLLHAGDITVRKGNEVGAEAYGTGDIPFIRTSDISNYEVSINDRGVSDEVYERYASQQNLKPGTILLVVDGRYRIGRSAILNEHTCRSVVQSHLRIISTTSRARITSIELLFLLNLPFVQHQMRNLVFIQSTLGVLGKRLFEVKLPLPARSPKWQATVDEFGSLLETRARTLTRLTKFESVDFEL